MELSRMTQNKIRVQSTGIKFLVPCSLFLDMLRGGAGCIWGGGVRNRWNHGHGTELKGTRLKF